MLMPTFLNGATMRLPRRVSALNRPRILRRSRYRMFITTFPVGLSIAAPVVAASGPHARLRVLVTVLLMVGTAYWGLRPRLRLAQPELRPRQQTVLSDDEDELLWTFGLRNGGGTDAEVVALAWTLTRDGEPTVVRNIPALFAALGTPLSPYEQIPFADPPLLYISPGETKTLIAVPVRALAGVTGLLAHVEFTNFADTRFAYDVAAELPEAPWSSVSTTRTAAEDA